MEGRVERSLLDAEHVGGDLLDVGGDRVSVEPAARGEGFEHEQAERALEDVVLCFRHVGGREVQPPTCRKQRTTSSKAPSGSLVLKTLAARGPLHGYAITSHIQQVSADLLRVEEGSLYPALHRMEQETWVRAEWGTTEKNRQARFYTLTALGRKQLAHEEESWARLTEGVRRVLRYA